MISLCHVCTACGCVVSSKIWVVPSQAPLGRDMDGWDVTLGPKTTKVPTFVTVHSPIPEISSHVAQAYTWNFSPEWMWGSLHFPTKEKCILCGILFVPRLIFPSWSASLRPCPLVHSCNGLASDLCNDRPWGVTKNKMVSKSTTQKYVGWIGWTKFPKIKWREINRAELPWLPSKIQCITHNT